MSGLPRRWSSILPTALALAAVSLGLAAALQTATADAEPAAASIRGNTQTAFSQCQRTVARLIGAPSAVSFAPPGSTAVTPVAGGWRFLSYADAENQAGGTTRVRWVCTADPLLNDTFSIHAQLLS